MRNALSAGVLYACNILRSSLARVSTPSSPVREREKEEGRERERKRERENLFLKE